MSGKPNANLVRGTVDLMVLKGLEQGPAHGLAIARWIRRGSGDVVSFEDAALYQSLHRLQRRGMVTSAWGRSESNRRARFYRLTEKGRGKLAAESQEFRDLTSAIVRLLEADAGRR